MWPAATGRVIVEDPGPGVPVPPMVANWIPEVAVRVMEIEPWLAAFPPLMPRVVLSSRLCPTVMGDPVKDIGTTVAANDPPKPAVLNPAGPLAERVVVPALRALKLMAGETGAEEVPTV